MACIIKLPLPRSNIGEIDLNIHKMTDQALTIALAISNGDRNKAAVKLGVSRRTVNRMIEKRYKEEQRLAQKEKISQAR